MSLDIIKQEAESIKETLYVYEDLVRKKSDIKNKRDLKKIENEIKEIKRHILYLSKDIDNVLKEERLKIKNV